MSVAFIFSRLYGTHSNYSDSIPSNKLLGYCQVVPDGTFQTALSTLRTLRKHHPEYFIVRLCHDADIIRDYVPVGEVCQHVDLLRIQVAEESPRQRIPDDHVIEGSAVV